MTNEEVRTILYNNFGFCGCTESQPIIDDIITLLKWCETGVINKWKPNYNVLLGNQSLFYVLAGILSNLEFIEHGTAIRCPWITNKGKEFLLALQQWKDE